MPRGDLPIFARGIVPRQDTDGKRIERAAARVRSLVEDAGLSGLGEIAENIGEEGNSVFLRLAVAVAGLPIRWDARTTTVLPGLPYEIDDEDARQELARRFLRSLGPADPHGFMKWAAVSEDDAIQTFGALERSGELVDVSVKDSGAKGSLLASDIDSLTQTTTVKSVRFIPFGGDPVLQPGDDVVAAVRSSHGRTRLISGGRGFDLPRWAVGGAVLVDEEIVAAFGRQQKKITLLPFRPINARDRIRIEEEQPTCLFQVPGRSQWSGGSLARVKDVLPQYRFDLWRLRNLL